ncbi:MAG: SH3 domain-containing protein [Spirochaetota bacterium]|nr:SH3 domain-containing protein [Spirochaetota bacterium]
MKKKIKWLLLTVLITSMAFASSNDILYVTNSIARLQQSPSAFSPVIGILKFSTPITVNKDQGKWFYVRTNKGNIGYISKESLIDENTLKRQADAKKSGNHKAGVKGFSEEDEITAGTKGFSEEEEITAGTKGFSEAEEVSAGTKGFNPDVEAQQKNSNPKYRYNLVDDIEKNIGMLNPQTKLKKFRKKGKLGEFK